jgi:hypothetical protein
LNVRVYILAAAILVALLLPTHTYSAFTGTTYHVAINGDDSANGTEFSPWRTIGHGVANLKPGDTLIIHEGAYNEAVNIEVTGTEYGYIRIVGQGQVIFSGEGIESDGVVLSPEVSFLELEGIHVTGFSGSWGLALYGGNNHITLRNIEVDHCETGMRITVGNSGEPPEFGSTDYVALENVHLHHNSVGGFDCTPGPCYNLTVRDSEFAHNGVEAGFGADGFAVEIGDHVLLERVKSHDNKGDGIDIGSRNPLIGNTTGDITVHESEVYANQKNGLKLWSGGAVINSIVHSNGLCGLVIIYDSNYEVVNTIVARNGQENRDYGMTAGYPLEKGLAGNDNIRLTIFNSIFAFNGPRGAPTGVYVGKGVTFLSDNNIWYSRLDEEIFLDAKQKAYSQDDINGKALFAETGNDEHSISADPMFVNMDVNDFNLSSDSPAIDAGAPVFQGIDAPSIDIFGNERPYGSYDIGPTEYGSTSKKTTTTSSTAERQTSPATSSPVATTREQQAGSSEDGYLFLAIVIVAVGLLGATIVVRSRGRNRQK